jgi:hypothetical protein
MVKLYRPAVPGQPILHEHTIPVFVADTLESLHGPANGIVELPITLDWSPNPRYDLDDPARRRTMYAIVLREARSERDLYDFLNAELLERIWLNLVLPEFIRSSWEERFPGRLG